MDHKDKSVPLDERYRLAQQHQLELPPIEEQEEYETADGTCPYHQAFIYECPYCNPR